MNEIKFVADIGSNFNGSFYRCLALIDAAKEIGCWGIKIQLFQADKLYAPNHIPKGIKEREFPREWVHKIADYCNNIDIKFGGTPFDLEAVEILKYYVDFFKISSFDILRHDLLKKCALYGNDLIVSIGMATTEEILNSRKIIAMNKYGLNSSIYYLHCISDYPTKLEDCRFGNIDALDKLFRYHKYITKIGWSDHTGNIIAFYKAQMLNVSMIEFHLDLNDQLGWEFAYGHCYTPKMIGRTIYTMEQIDIATDIQYWNPLTPEMEEKRANRADPSDGLRPMKEIR